jgi:tRNA(Ile)-lysidine synthase
VATATAFLERVETFWRRLVPEGAGAVVAVSGGPDSVALLRALARLSADGTCGPLVVAHVNHGLRGRESDADEAFVRDLSCHLQSAEAPNLEWRGCRLDTVSLAREQGANLEAVARAARYDWLAGLAQERGLRWVATGHTADDQAETVLHRLLRGSGLQGLRGIPIQRALADGLWVVRPLLRLRRAEVLAFLESVQQPFRTDSTNSDPTFTRNRIRHQLLPLLASDYNPAITEAICRLAEQAESVFRHVAEAAATLRFSAELPRTASLLIFDRRRLAAAPRHVIREALRQTWAREGWPLGGMGFDDWERLAAVVLGETTALDLPGGIHARAREHVLQIGPTTGATLCVSDTTARTTG